MTDTRIQFGTGWNCCAANPAKVIVFDEGTRWAVCKSCASRYAGEVQELPESTDGLVYVYSPGTTDGMSYHVGHVPASGPVRPRIATFQTSTDAEDFARAFGARHGIRVSLLPSAE